MTQPASENSASQRAKQPGFVVLLGVILLGVIGVTIASSLVFLGLSSGLGNLAFSQSQSANFLAAACAEQALDQTREDPSYAGSETVSLAAGGCEIFPVTMNGSVYVIKTQGTVRAAVRRVEVLAERQDGPPAFMRIVSWQEVGDF